MEEQSSFERARSPQAKQEREQAILAAAARLATERGVRAVTLTDIAADVGLHKSAMLRYFETREEIFLRLSVAGWQDWSAAVRADLDGLGESRQESPQERAARVAAILADSLASRPLFCDLLAHTSLSLERNVSLATVRVFKVSVLAEVTAIAVSLCGAVPIADAEARDVVATATGMAGAMWQMAAPGTQLRDLYETDPELSHAVVEVGPRLTAILARLLSGSLSH